MPWVISPNLIGATGASFVFSLLGILALRPLAVAVDLVDRPGGRKTHRGEVPIVGGLAMFLGLVLGVGLLNSPEINTSVFLAPCALLVVVGLLDDRFDLSPWTRLTAHAAAAYALVAGTGLPITSLGDPFGSGAITLNQIGATIFTILAMVAAVNAFNMLDGMDGLAGTTAVISLSALGYVAWSGGSFLPAQVAMITIASVCAFLVFNFPTSRNRNIRCFMGDAGSTLLGFTLAWICISVSQGAHAVVPPVTTLWIVALPLCELVWTTIRRMVKGNSPFRADSRHFHHLLLQAGLGVRGAFYVFVVLTTAFAFTGWLLWQAGVPEVISFFALVLAGVLVVRLMHSAQLLRKLLPRSFRRSPPRNSEHVESTPPT
jgi:UDP-GlcNAc:undecaprenyl-phosphate GlcNAc-1-phosphate transferase